MKTFALIFFVCLPLVARSAPIAAGDPLYDEYEGAELAAMLLRDGKNDAAKAALEGLSRSERKEKAALIGKLNGDISLLEGRTSEAASHFLRALQENATESLRMQLELGLARAYQRLGKPSDCAKAASRAGELVFRQEGDALVKAACERAAGENGAAWKTLDRAGELKLGFSVNLEKVRLMLSMGLRQEASLRVLSHIAGKATPSEAMALAEALLEAGAKEESLLALEMARLRFPNDQEVLLAIAPLYFAKGLKRATAEAFTIASVRDHNYAEHAAETLRQFGARQRSRYLNLFIPGEKERGRQKLALAVESSRWDLVASMDGFVKRTSLEEDDEVNYAVGFSLLRGGEGERSRSYLEKIRSPSFLPKVSALFKSIEECGKKSWLCL